MQRHKWESMGGIAVDLLEKFTSKIVITPDYEEGGVLLLILLLR